jgi:hypothetical protein
MAKETKKTGIGIAEVTSSNLDECLKNANKMDQEVLEMATSKMEKEEKERKADELMRKIKKANYQNFRLHIDFKYNEETSDIEKEALKEQKTRVDALMTGEITPVEYDKAVEDICTEATKKIKKAGDERRGRIKELQNRYGEWYGLRWDDPFLMINEAIRSNAR